MNKRRNLGLIPHLCAALTMLTSHAAAQQLDLGEALRGPLFATQGQMLKVKGSEAGTSIYVGGRKESCSVEECVIPQNAALGRQTLRFEPPGNLTVNGLLTPKNIYILPSDKAKVKVFLNEIPFQDNDLRSIDRELAYFNSSSGYINDNFLTINDLDYVMSSRLGESFSLSSRITPGDLKNIRQVDSSSASYPLWAYLSPTEAKILEKYLKELKNKNGGAVAIRIPFGKPANIALDNFTSRKSVINLPNSITRSNSFAEKLLRQYEQTNGEKISQNTRQLLTSRLMAGNLPVILYGISDIAKKNLGFSSYSVPRACSKLRYLTVKSADEFGFYTWLSREYSLGVSIDPTAEPIGGQLPEQEGVETFLKSVSESRQEALISRNYGHAEMSSGLDASQPKLPAIVFILDTMEDDGIDKYSRKVKISNSVELFFEGHGRLIKDIISAVNEDAPIQFKAIKICENGVCGMEKLIASVCQAAAVKIGNPEHRVLINMSFSTPLPGKTLQSVIEYAAKEGVEIIASHGNAPKERQNDSPAEPLGYSCRNYTLGDMCHHFPGDWSKNQQSIISVAPVDCGPDKKWSISKYSRAALPAGSAQSVPPSVYFPGSWPFPVKLNGQETYADYNGASFATAVATAIMIRNGHLKGHARPDGRC
ncbi:S8 family serine peptidase [Deinococcus sp. LM3]|uniref:S8 family serine peptidase n=1 Tax=Deinococcus sp. LM3 TaxID=1938608 RepID=UPI00143A35E8|nr:S8 family serine peptidase [Deinococcus sp. LM3]